MRVKKLHWLMPAGLEDPCGAGRVFPIAREMAQLGWQVRVTALHADFAGLPRTRRRFVRDGVQVEYIGQLHVRKVSNYKYYFSTSKLLQVVLHAALAFNNSVHRYPADILHVCKPYPMNGVAGLLHRPFYLDYEEYETGATRFGGRWQKSIIQFCEEHIPRYAQVVTAHTRANVARINRYGVPAERICYLPNGIDRNRFEHPSIPAKSHAIQAQLGISAEPTIVCVSSLTFNHPLDLLIDAFAQVHAVLPQACLVLAGGGEDYDRLAGRVKELNLTGAVRMPGRIPAADVPAYLAFANVTVDPVHDDEIAAGRSPLKVLESMAMGIPVVTGDVGDRREMLADGEAGLLVKAGDPAALATGLLSVLTDQPLHARLSSKCLRQRQHYYWDHLVRDRLLPLYCSTLQAGRGYLSGSAR